MLEIRTLLAALCGVAITNAAFDIGFGSDNDLSRYVTRPEIKAPLFDVTVYEPEEVTPGHWFIAPYAKIIQDKQAANYYQACQTGPAIYDSNGELIWSGACLTKNQNACDFRVFTANGSMFLSTIFSWYPAVDPIGHGVILDSSMQVTKRVHTPVTLIPFNMHEFYVLNEGGTALHIIQKTELADVSHLEQVQGMASGLVVNMGIREFDLRTGEELFTWWANDHIDLNASSFSPKYINGPYPEGWDWIHLNAIDKNSDGDYMTTARYTDAVYKISGKDGHIIWSLGGTTSSFLLDGFNFSRPHDARFVSSDATSETITLLDNGGCEEFKSSDVSSALIIHLDKSSEPWTASVEKRWTRPDNGRSDKRGNFQLLPNGNAFVGWSENSYISEHSPDNRLLMEARFKSERFVTYRSYKFNFTSAPAEPPVLKGFAFGESPASSASVYYVSWNGATEVASWEFHSADGFLLGKAPRSGFETTFQQSSYYVDEVYAKAVSVSGVVLGTTAVEIVESPSAWATSEGATEDDHGRVEADASGKTEL